MEMMRKEDGIKILKISRNLNDTNFYESMGYLRFNSISDYNQLAVLEVSFSPLRKYQASKSRIFHTCPAKLRR
jgi:hypothetical protein